MRTHPESETRNSGTYNYEDTSRNSVNKPEKEKNDSVVEIHESESPDSAIQEIPFSRIIIIFIGLSVAQFLAAIDSTIVATAMPHIGTEFNALDRVSWIVTSYLLTYNSFQAAFACLSEHFGRKFITLLGIFVFIVFSALCAIANSLEILSLMRALQGIGGSAIYVMFNIIPGEILPIHQRGLWQSAGNIIWAVSAVAGPLAGGFCVDHFSWRYAFMINVPIGIFSMITIYFSMRDSTTSKRPCSKWGNIDFIGIWLIVSFSVFFMVTISLAGNSEYPWISPYILGGFGLSVASLAVLVYWELYHAKTPLFPIRLFKKRTLVFMYLTNLGLATPFFAVLFYVPFFFQVVRGDTAVGSGVKLIPIEFSITIASFLAAYVQSRWFVYRPSLVAGSLIFSAGLGLMLLLDENSSDLLAYICICVCGTGLGFNFSSGIIAVQSAVDSKDMAIVTGLMTFFRCFAGLLGVAIGSTVINMRLSSLLSPILTPEQASAARTSITYIRESLTTDLQLLVIHAYVEAIHSVWFIMTILAALSVICVLFVKHYSLRRDLESDKAEMVCKVFFVEVDGGEANEKTIEII